MTCRDCRLPLGVEQTLKGDDVDTRIHQCACGSRWLSESRIVRRLQPTQIRGTSKARPPDKEPTSPPSSGGGFGGDPSAIPSGTTDSNPISPGNPKRARTRSNGEAIDYPKDFEILWEQTGRRGVKFNALKAWMARGRPGWVDVQAAWRAYLLSERPVAGYIKDLSSWLNGRGHQQEWAPAAKAPLSAVPPWKQAERDEEQRKRDERNREAAARERIQREQQEALKKAGFA